MLEVKVENCAGIDVGKKFLAVCVLTGPVDRKPAEEVRRFGTSVKELERLRAWLVEMKCTEAVMESTGSYWKPVFNILEGSLKIILANPQQVKALRGKKTDPNDRFRTVIIWHPGRRFVQATTRAPANEKADECGRGTDGCEPP
jgi:transposase